MKQLKNAPWQAPRGVGAVYDRTLFEPNHCALIERTYTVSTIRYRPLSGRYDEGPPRGPIRASLLPAFWPSQSTCRFRPMTWTPSDTTDAIQSVVGLTLSFANDGLLQFARGGSLMETVYQNCTTGRSNLFESHRQRRWLTVVSYPMKLLQKFGDRSVPLPLCLQDQLNRLPNGAVPARGAGHVGRTRLDLGSRVGHRDGEPNARHRR